MVTCTVHGARGYLGRELVRLLLEHPNVDQVYPVSTKHAGEPYGALVPGFQGSELTFTTSDDAAALAADVVFLAVPAGAAAPLIEAHEANGAKVVIDLSRDHRHAGLGGKDGWVYGIADINPVKIGASRIANPGCYPTAALLALAPALKAGLIGPGAIIVDGKSGVSGAGVSLRDDLHYSAMNESVHAYKVLGHDHTSEIASAAGLLNGAVHPVRFTPHLVPMTRGLLATVYAPILAGTTSSKVQQTYQDAYGNHPRVHLVDEADTAHVRGSNHAQVAVDLDEENGLLIIRGAIDNIQKGGAGTAVQNMNDALGFPSGTGLTRMGGNL